MREMKTLREAVDDAKEKLKHPGTGATKESLKLKIAIAEDLISMSPVDETYFIALVKRNSGTNEGWIKEFIGKLIGAGWVVRQGGKLIVVAEKTP